MNKKLLKVFVFVVLIATIALSVAACDYAPPTKLKTPTLTISEDGYAMWREVKGAVGYKYKINNGYEQSTGKTTVKLSNNDTIMVKAVGDGTYYIDSNYGESKKYYVKVEVAQKLSAPVVSVSKDGVATWTEIENATAYVYKIDDGEEKQIQTTSVTLSDGQSITVKAIGNGKNYLDSEFSKSVKFVYGQAICGHKDSDGDGVCEDCGITIAVFLDFFAVNDLHGKIFDTADQPGVDNLTTYLKGYQKTGKTVLLSSGDMWQGTAESSLTKGNMMTDWMNEAGFDAMTLGNHEFDWGESRISENYEIAKFPFLAINVRNRSTNQIPSYCQPSVMIERAGVKIGIIGAIGDCYSSISASMVADVYFVTGNELTALVKEESQRLRAAGADIIVYSLHDSSTSGGYNNALSAGYVDLVFEGHTHSDYVRTDNYGIYHLQGSAENRGISYAQIKYDCLTGEKSVVKAEYVQNSNYANKEPDPIINKLKAKYSAQLQMVAEVLGYNESRRDSDELKNLVASLYAQKGIEKWGGKYNIVLGGGFLSIRSPYDLSVGQVSYSMLCSLMPFDNRIVLCSISGKDLKNRYFENSSYYMSYSDYGVTVRNNLNESATYYIVTDTYNSDYAPNNLTIVEYYDDSTYARDFVAEYIRNGGMGSQASGDDYVLTTIEEALNIGAALGAGAETEAVYYVKGTIDSVQSTTYGNLYISDGNGNQIYVYGLYDQNGTRYDKMENKPQAGDEIIVSGKIFNYNGTIEIKNAVLVKNN